MPEGTFNRQGRAASDSMRLRDFKGYIATLKPKPQTETFTYRGIEISGTAGGSWFVERDPRVFKSKAAAMAAVDACLALRAELAGEGR